MQQLLTHANPTHTEPKMSAPKLEHHCGSWIVVSRATGKPVLETFSKTVADAINTQRYEVLTALQYLSKI